MKKNIVLITGAASGIGLETARQFIELGATVVGADRDSVKIEEAATELGSNFLARTCDMTRADEVKALVAYIDEQLGHLDVLVNNAGVARGVSLEDTEEADYTDHFDILVKAPIFLTKYCIPLLRKSDDASIVIVSSAAARNEGPNHHLYSTAKAAIEKFTYHLVRDFPGIRSNVVLPGLIDTPIVRAVVSTEEEVAGIFGHYVNGVPCGRVGKPVDIANCILFLSSSKASYINGAAIVVDGGWLRSSFGALW